MPEALLDNPFSVVDLHLAGRHSQKSHGNRYGSRNGKRVLLKGGVADGAKEGKSKKPGEAVKSSLGSLQKQLPMVKIDEVREVRKDDDLSTSAHMGHKSGVVVFNPAKLNASGLAEIEKQQKQGFLVKTPGSDPVKYLATHEFGHSIGKAIGEGASDPDTFEEYAPIQALYAKVMRSDAQRSSAYAKTNRAEAFAESFADYMLNPPGHQSPHAKEVGEVVEALKKLKKRRGTDLSDNPFSDLAFDPNQARDEKGRWIGIGASYNQKLRMVVLQSPGEPTSPELRQLRDAYPQAQSYKPLGARGGTPFPENAADNDSPDPVLVIKGKPIYDHALPEARGRLQKVLLGDGLRRVWEDASQTSGEEEVSHEDVIKADGRRGFASYLLDEGGAVGWYEPGTKTLQLTSEEESPSEETLREIRETMPAVTKLYLWEFNAMYDVRTGKKLNEAFVSNFDFSSIASGWRSNPFSDFAFDPSQPRDEKGRWVSVGGGFFSRSPQKDGRSAPEKARLVRKSAISPGVEWATFSGADNKEHIVEYSAKSKTLKFKTDAPPTPDIVRAAQREYPAAEKLKHGRETLQPDATATPPQPPLKPATTAAIGRPEGEATPLGRPVSSSFVGGLANEQTKMGEAFRAALAAVDEVHGDGPLPKVTSRSNAGIRQSGLYEQGPSPTISIKPESRAQAFTAVHEIGHLLDGKGLANGAIFATDDSASNRINGVLNALEDSEPVKTLYEMRADPDAWYEKHRKTDEAVYYPSKEYSLYLARPAEQFARGYAQYIATRSSSAELKNQLRRAQDEHRYPVQWSDEEFAPIAREFDRLFDGVGWSESNG